MRRLVRQLTALPSVQVETPLDGCFDGGWGLAFRACIRRRYYLETAVLIP